MRILNTEELRSVYGGHGKGKHNGKHKACATTTRRNTSSRRKASTRRKNTTSRRKVAKKYY